MVLDHRDEFDAYTQDVWDYFKKVSVCGAAPRNRSAIPLVHDLAATQSLRSAVQCSAVMGLARHTEPCCVADTAERGLENANQKRPWWIR